MIATSRLLHNCQTVHQTACPVIAHIPQALTVDFNMLVQMVSPKLNLCIVGWLHFFVLTGCAYRHQVDGSLSRACCYLSSAEGLCSQVIMKMPADHHIHMIPIEKRSPFIYDVLIKLNGVIGREMEYGKFPVCLRRKQLFL